MVEILCKQSWIFKYVIHTVKYTIKDAIIHLLNCQIDITLFKCFGGDLSGLLRLTNAFELVYELLNTTLISCQTHHA